MTHGPASVSLLGLAIPGQLGGVRCAENLVSRVPFSTGPAVGQVVLSSRRASRSHAPGGQCVSCDRSWHRHLCSPLLSLRVALLLQHLDRPHLLLEDFRDVPSTLGLSVGSVTPWALFL